MKPFTRLFWTTALSLSALCVAALYETGQIIQSGQYLFGNLWLTTAVFFCFLFPAALIVEYVLLLFVPLKWSTKTARGWILGVESIALAVVLIYARLQWTSESLTGKGFADYPELMQLFVAAFVATVIARVVFFQGSHESVAAEPMKKRFFPPLLFGLFGVLMLAGVYMNYSNGQNDDLQNDEFLQYAGAAGYNRTGEFVRWDFRTDAVKRDAADEIIPYERAEISTWQIAQSTKLFGETEWAARFPAQVWFVLLLFTVYTIAFLFSRSVTFAFITTVSLLFFDGFLMHARFVRMYSPLLTLSVWAVIAFWYTYGWFIRGQWLRWIGGTALTAGLFFIAWLHHELVLIIAPAMACFIAYEWAREVCVRLWARVRSRQGELSVVDVSDKAAQRYRTVFLALSVFAGAGLWILNESFNSRIFTLGHLGLRDTVGYQYQFLPFMDLALPLIAMGVYCLAVVYALIYRKAKPAERYLAVVSVGVILLFIIVARRYSAYRYVQLIVPLCIALVWVVWHRYIAGLFQGLRLTTMQRFVSIVSAVSFFILFIPLSIPGVSAQFPWLTNPVDHARTYGYENGFHTSAAYNFIREHKRSSDPLFAMVFRDTYWKNDPELPLVTIPRNREYTKDRLTADLARFSGKDVWFVWDAEKDPEIPKETRRFITQYAQNMSVCTKELRESNMHVYYLGAGEIPCPDATLFTDASWSDGVRVIAHGLGNVGDDVRTDSKEGFLTSVKEGNTVLEVDLTFTKDDYLVVRHDWDVPIAGDKVASKPLSYQDFLKTKIAGKYTPIDTQQLLQLLQDHPSVQLVIDVKGSQYAEVLGTFKQQIQAIDPQLFNRIILQTYQPEDVVAAKRFSDHSHLLLTLYRTDMTDADVLAFVTKEHISVVTISQERFSQAFATQLAEKGVRVYVHTINDPKKVESLQGQGAYGVYSDVLINAEK